MKIIAYLVIPLMVACNLFSERRADPVSGLKISDLDRFSVVSERKSRIRGEDVEERQFANGEATATLRSISGASVDTFSKAVALREFELGRPFRAERSPYAGAVTEDVQCPEQFRPRFTKIVGPQQWVWRAEIYSSGRKNQVCSQTDFVFKAVEIMVFCPGVKKFFIINAYAPKLDFVTDWSVWLKSVQCDA